MDIGRVGIWGNDLNFQPARTMREAARDLDALGYGALWIGEALYREPLVNAGVLLSATERMVVATGIANVWARDPVTMLAGQLTLAEAFPERFLLGLGASHARLVEGLRGHQYEKPLSKMRGYLDRMDEAREAYRSPRPASGPPRVLAALGPKMLSLAAQRADGAHTYFVSPEHTAWAREQLGEGPWLVPEQAAVVDTDPSRARTIARSHTRRYLKLPNYEKNLRRLGFRDEDLSGDGSDRLVDALVAWGDPDTIAERVRAHHDAGADHVCIQVLPHEDEALPLAEWRELASALR